MATIGQQLLSPESGWRRYDDSDSRIIYGSGWTLGSNTASLYGSYQHYINSNGGAALFKFNGTKIRIIATQSTDKAINNKVNIDGVDYMFTEYGVTQYQTLVFEKLDLSPGVHTVSISGTAVSASAALTLDAIDTDGYLVHPILNQVSRVEDMQIGDCIPCCYWAGLSANTGNLYSLGISPTSKEIPVAPAATVDGLFYLIKVAKGLLIADRYLQGNVTFDMMNNAGLFDGTYNMDISKSKSKPAVFLSNTFSYTSNCTGTFNANNDVTVTATTLGSAAQLNGPGLAKGNYQSLYFEVDQITKASLAQEAQLNQFVIAWYKNGYYFQLIFKKDLIQLQGIVGGVSSYINIYTEDYTKVAISRNEDNKNLHIVVDNKIAFDGVVDWITASWVTYTQVVFTLITYAAVSRFKFNNVSYWDGYASNMRPFVVNGKPILWRLPSGGCAPADANGNKLMNVSGGVGGYPANNDWDTYIRKSDLGGKITPGDNNVWHYTGKYTFTTEATATGVVSGSATMNNTYRALRGVSLNLWAYTDSTYTDANVSFRLVAEYFEADGKGIQPYGVSY